MLNRLLGKGGNKSAAAGPPGSHANQGSSAAAPAEEPMGGGFFNLPPMPAKHAPYGGGITAATTTAAPNAPGPASYSRPSQLPGASYHPQQPPPPAAPHLHSHVQPHVPTYGHSASMGSTNYDVPPPAAANHGGLDMFGGMAIKNPPAATGPSTYAPQAAAVGATTGGSLFSGLDVAGNSSLTSSAPPDPHHHQPLHHHHGATGMGDRRKLGTRATGSFNYLDVAASTDTQQQQHSRTSSNASAASSTASAARTSSMPKVVKKKKTKSFRPGFGRQLSDESIAALQRGDLKEKDVVALSTANDNSSNSNSVTAVAAPPQPATHATDLAHLLPPVGSTTATGGSMLSGLTVHKAASNAGSSSVLAGLTLHAAATNAPASPRTASKRNLTSAATADASAATTSTSTGVLAGLNVHPNQPTTSSRRTTDATEPPTPTPALTPPVATAPLTPEQRLATTLRDFYASAERFRDVLTQQREAEAALLERKTFLTHQLAQYELDLRAVEAQQQRACEVEDFERADALNATLNSVRHCITLSDSDVRKVDAELAACLKAAERAFANQLRSTRGTLRELEAFRDAQDRARSELRAASRAFDTRETQTLQFEAERIDAERHHVAASLAHVATERTEIDATIDEQCKDERAARTSLLTEKQAVDDEVRALEALLATKRARASELQLALDATDRDIDAVRTRYTRQLKRLADREAAIRTTQTEVDADAQQLEAQQRAFHETLAQYKRDAAACTVQLASVRQQLKAAARLTQVLETQERRREQAAVRKRTHSAELGALADAAAVAEQSFVMLRKQHDELDKSLGVHRNAIASAESMLPRLEAEKRAAAAARNFKDAARMSKDIKALEKDRATAEEMVEVVEMELSDLSDRIAKRERECDDKRAELRALEQQLELAALSELWKEAAHLRHAMRKLSKRNSRTSIVDNAENVDNVDFRTSALLLVQAELDVCVVQVDALEAKYDVRNPNADAAADGDSSSDDDDDVDDDGDDDDDNDDDNGVGRDRRTSREPNGANDDDSADNDNDVDGDIDSRVDDAQVLEAIAAKLVALETQIDSATEREEYELAERLDEQIDALKQRQHALLALAPRESPVAADSPSDEESDQDDDEVDTVETDQYSAELDQHDTVTLTTAGSDNNDNTAAAHDHDAQTVDELRDELAALRERIVHVEDDIDLATQSEEYESAAAYDDELQELRAEQEAIERLLDAARSRESDTTTSTPSSLFIGLGVKQPSVEERDIASVETAATDEAAPSLFGGLSVAAPAPELTTVAVNGSDAISASLFGGLQLSGGSASSQLELAKPPSPIEIVAQTDAAAGIDTVTAPTAAIDSPTASHVTGVDSFFGALRVSGNASATVHYPSPASSIGGSASLFGGLQLSDGAAAEPTEPTAETTESVASHDATSVSVFSGLSVTETVAALGHESIETTTTTVTDVVDTTTTTSNNSSNSMFTDLHVSASSAESHSRAGSASSLLDTVDALSSDSPMTIHELSDHALATDDEDEDSTSLSGSGVSHRASSFADISFASTAITTLATEPVAMTTTTTTSVSDSSLFGGLAVAQPATTDATVVVDNNNAEANEDVKHALPTEL